uniref:DUF1499 domain-containing protein n=1 Tax=Cyanothece sp. (strain PCC 7425 / ATCC 29141) TaxID=395961 RepID=B8HLP7_CYAP4
MLALVLLVILNPGNVAETTPDAADPWLRSRRYPPTSNLLSLCQTIQEIIPTLRTYGQPWRVVAGCNGTEGKQVVRAEVPVLIFTDDLEVTLTPIQGEEVQVDVYSASRVGQSDLGENRRHLRQILQALDKQ